MVAYKRDSNLKDLLVRGDPYSVKEQTKMANGYTKCGKRCDSL